MIIVGVTGTSGADLFALARALAKVGADVELVTYSGGNEAATVEPSTESIMSMCSNVTCYKEPPPPPEPEEPNGDLSFLYRQPAQRSDRPAAHLTRRSEPRWRQGRWKSNT